MDFSTEIIFYIRAIQIVRIQMSARYNPHQRELIEKDYFNYLSSLYIPRFINTSWRWFPILGVAVGALSSIVRPRVSVIGLYLLSFDCRNNLNYRHNGMTAPHLYLCWWQIERHGYISCETPGTVPHRIVFNELPPPCHSRGHRFNGGDDGAQPCGIALQTQNCFNTIA